MSKASKKISSDLMSKAVTKILFWLAGLLLLLASYFPSVWILIPLNERFVFIPWILLFYTYYICSKIEEVHGITKREKILRKKNYKYTLYWGVFPLLIHYSPIFINVLPQSDAEAYKYIYDLINWSSQINIDIFGLSETRGRVITLFQVFGLIIALYGSWLATTARIHLNGFWAIDIHDYGDERKIISTGPYSNVRHPIYAGQIMLVFGTAFVFLDLFMFIFSLIVFLMNRARAKVEENELKQLSEDYTEYCKNTEFMIYQIY